MARKHFIQHHGCSPRVQVPASTSPVSSRWGEEYCTLPKTLCVKLCVKQKLIRNAEVENLHLARRSNADIARLQVTMNNAPNRAAIQGS